MLGNNSSPFENAGYNRTLDNLPPHMQEIPLPDEIKKRGAAICELIRTEMRDKDIDPESRQGFRYALKWFARRGMELLKQMEELIDDDQRQLFPDREEGTGEKISHIHQGQQGSAGDGGRG